ncbi:hypothetical protein ACT3UD_03780 [Glutamicibacter sp. 287]|uniref:hypothetical protein n=1 Tax=unclassified Glutamicibacter TaxID=2627139 RepID=UPI0040332ECD
MPEQKPKPHELLFFILYLAACALMAGLPFLIGFLTPLWLPQLGELKQGLWPWVPVLVIVFTLVLLATGEITDRLVRLLFPDAGKIASNTLESLLSFVVIVGCYYLVMSTYPLALASAAISVAVYLLCTPLINRLTASAPRDTPGAP